MRERLASQFRAGIDRHERAIEFLVGEEQAVGCQAMALGGQFQPLAVEFVVEIEQGLAGRTGIWQHMVVGHQHGRTNQEASPVESPLAGVGPLQSAHGPAGADSQLQERDGGQIVPLENPFEQGLGPRGVGQELRELPAADRGLRLAANVLAAIQDPHIVGQLAGETLTDPPLGRLDPVELHDAHGKFHSPRCHPPGWRSRDGIGQLGSSWKIAPNP